MSNNRIPVIRGSGNVFRDIGFHEIEAAELTAKAELTIAVRKAVKSRGLSQRAAARICGTDQPTLSKVINGRTEGVTIDRLSHWLVALGRRVEIRVAAVRGGRGKLIVNAA